MSPERWFAAAFGFATLWLAPAVALATEGGRAGGYYVPPCEGCGTFPWWAQTLLTVLGVVLAFALMYGAVKLLERLRGRPGAR